MIHYAPLLLVFLLCACKNPSHRSDAAPELNEMARETLAPSTKEILKENTVYDRHRKR